MTSACDSREPVGPGVVQPPPTDPRMTHWTEWDVAGTFSIPVPRNGADVPWISTGITLEKGDEAQIVVEGQLKLGLDAAFKSTVCTQQGSLPFQCGHYQRIGYALIGPKGGVPGGSSAYDDMLRVILGLNRDGVRTKFGGGDGSPEGRIVGSANGPGTIEVMRIGIPPSSAMHYGIQIYDLTGTQTVTVFVNRARKPKLVLECNGSRGSVSVERGGAINCTAKTEPGGAALEVTEWTFEGEGSTVPGPAGSPTWDGPMVAGGTITVEATVDGKPQDASIGVTVSSRNWAAEFSYPPEPEPQFVGSPDLPYPPVTLPNENPVDGTFGEYIGSVPLPENEPIFGGPNDGWWYVSAPPPFSARHVIHINVALDPRDPFYQAQRGGSGMCDRRFMDYARRFTIDHEKQHYSVDRSFYQSGEFAQLIEAARVYDPDGALSEKEFEAKMFGPYRERREELQDAVDGSQLQLTCKFHLLQKR